MDSLRKYTFRYVNWIKTVEFFSDRLESSSDFWGLGVEKKKKIILRTDLTPNVTESSGPSKGIKQAWLRAALSLLLFLVLYILLPSPWRYSSLLFFLLLLFHSYYAVLLSQKLDWVFLYRKNGDTAAAVKINGWTAEERQEFHRFYTNWLIAPTYSLSGDGQRTTRSI